MSAVRLPGAVLADSFRVLRECGAGRAECVLYWCARKHQSEVVTRLVHPVHRAGPGWYEVDSGWVTRFFLDLRASRETVRAQVHTHPFEAGHSGIDDAFALVPAPGFLSLVIPDYAAGPARLTDTVLVRMGTGGTWMPVPPEEAILVE